MNIEQLEDRCIPTVGFNLGGGLLFVQGDNLGNSIIISASNDGTINISDHGRNVPIFGLSSNINNIDLVAVQLGKGFNNIVAIAPNLRDLPTLLDARLSVNTLFIDNHNSMQLNGSGLNLSLNVESSNPINLNDQGPNSIIFNTLAHEMNVSSNYYTTREQEAQVALNDAFFIEQEFALLGYQ